MGYLNLSNLVRQTTDGESEPAVGGAIGRINSTGIEIKKITQ